MAKIYKADPPLKWTPVQKKKVQKKVTTAL